MRAGDVVLVRFPFTSLDSTKKRPALLLRATVLTPKIQLLTVAMITSQIDKLKIEGDCLLDAWEAAKLLHPSLVRLAKVATLDLELIDKRLGRLSPSDLNVIRSRFCSLYKFWL